MKVTSRKWRVFRIDEIFDDISRPVSRSKNQYASGDIPFIASGASLNGAVKFCTPHTDELLDAANCITVSPVDGSCFYQPIDFLGRGGGGSSIIKLRSRYLNQDNGVFLAKAINHTTSKYQYGHMATSDGIKRERILLPVNGQGQPDYQFMADYEQELIQHKRERYLTYVNNRLAQLGTVQELKSVKALTWKPFVVGELFSSLVGGKGKGLVHLTKVANGGIEYIGATNRNNGVLCRVELNDISRPMVQLGNCIGFIKNGDGAAGYAIYKKESFISTTDVIYGYADWLNQYTGLFFVGAQDLIKPKYSHGYKRNAKHLSVDRVMLPVNDQGQPDYDYMEQYVKNLMIKKYQSYLDYVKQH